MAVSLKRCPNCGHMIRAGQTCPCQASQPEEAPAPRPDASAGRLVNCLNCGAEISTNVRTCPHCGRKRRWKLVIGLCAVPGAVLGFHLARAGAWHYLAAPPADSTDKVVAFICGCIGAFVGAFLATALGRVFTKGQVFE